MSADIDGLKIINDSFGHHQGDLILNLTAKLFKNSFRETDIVARVGAMNFTSSCREPVGMMLPIWLIVSLNGISECVLADQEKWDGSGYPRGLKDEEIPLLARICSLAVFCEEFEAEDQKKEWEKAEKIAALKDAAGSKYDPSLLNILISIL